MTIPTRTFTYVANTLAQSNQVNVNENTLYAWANGGIDDTNLNHLVGIYASSITGTTAAQCTFGTNPAASAGYKFVAPSSGLVPLTISGVTGQSVDILDVTLTSGGTKALFVTSAGGVAVGAGGLALGIGQLGVSSTVSAGQITLGGTGSSGAWDYGVTTAATHTWYVAGVAKMALSTSVLTAPQVAIPQGGVLLSAGSGLFQAGKTNNATQAMDFGNAIGAGAYTTIGSMGDTVNTIVGSQFEIKATGTTAQLTVDGAGNLGIVGTLHSASTRKAKKDIAPLTFDPLAIIEETDWVQYRYLGDPEAKQPHVGFIAEDSSEWLGGATKNYVIAQDVAGITAAGLKRLLLKLRAAGVAV